MSATLDLSPTVVNLKVARGDTWRVRIEVYVANPDGTPDLENPVDLDGSTLSSQFRHRATGEPFATATVDPVDLAAGTFDVVVAYGDTGEAPLGKTLAYDVQQDTGTERRTIITGAVRVVADWTQD